MKFCDECGSMMKSGEGEDHWVCTACGYEVGRDDDDEAVWRGRRRQRRRRQGAPDDDRAVSRV